jgi:hypothetical protein
MNVVVVFAMIAIVCMDCCSYKPGPVVSTMSSPSSLRLLAAVPRAVHGRRNDEQREADVQSTQGRFFQGWDRIGVVSGLGDTGNRID